MDSLIPIGFGALISALVTWVTLNLKHRHEFRREWIDRKLTRLETISDTVCDAEHFSDRLCREFCVLALVVKEAGQDEASEEEFSEIQSLLDSQWEIQSRLRRAENTARFIGANTLRGPIGSLQIQVQSLCTTCALRFEMHMSEMAQSDLFRIKETLKDLHYHLQLELFRTPK